MKFKGDEVKEEKQPMVMIMMISMVMRMGMKVVVMANMRMPINDDKNNGEATKAC